jgi:hypothetical protein
VGVLKFGPPFSFLLRLRNEAVSKTPNPAHKNHTHSYLHAGIRKFVCEISGSAFVNEGMDYTTAMTMGVGISDRSRE